MAFAPPRRPITRPSGNRKRSEAEANDSGIAKQHQKVQNVIAARHKEWLVDKHTKQETTAEMDSLPLQNIDCDGTGSQETKLFQSSNHSPNYESKSVEPIEVVDLNGSNNQYYKPYVSTISKSNIDSKGYDGTLDRKENSDLRLNKFIPSTSQYKTNDTSGLITSNYHGLHLSNNFGLNSNILIRNGSNNTGTTTSNYGAPSKVYNTSASNYSVTASNNCDPIVKNSDNYGNMSKLNKLTSYDSANYGQGKKQDSGKTFGENKKPMSTKELKKKADELLNKSKSDINRYGRRSRPENHFCPICKRLMALEGHNPICIIPCGHSVCEPCSRSLRNSCTICNHDIQTTTNNIVLKRIIEQFSEDFGLLPPQSAIPDEISRTNRVQSTETSMQVQPSRYDGLQKEGKNSSPEGKQEAYNFSTTVSNEATNQKPYNISGNSQPENSLQSIDLSCLKNLTENTDIAENPAIIPQIANINQQLTKLLKNYSGSAKSASSEVPIKNSGIKNSNEKKTMFEDYPDYVPSEKDLKKWTSKLSAVEMRISVMDLQVKQTSAAIVEATKRVSKGEEALKQITNREKQLLDNLKFMELQLKEVEMDKEKVRQQMNNDQAESDRCTEQLNLINYTKAGLEAEYEKLSLLCNRVAK